MTVPVRAPAVDAVVKVGGGLLQLPGAIDALAAALGALGPAPRTVVVPGGGPFADAVRAAAARTGVPDDAAHWMAILGMDQYAHLLAACVPRARLVERETEIGAALEAGALPVLAPVRWLRDADPLPHAWTVTSDSIAAWLAGVLGARRLVLVKPAAMPLDEAVDEYFLHALPGGVQAIVLGARDVGHLGDLLRDVRAPVRQRH